MAIYPKITPTEKTSMEEEVDTSLDVVLEKSKNPTAILEKKTLYKS